jgi:hypothetical protein
VLIQPALGGIDMLSFKAFDRAIEAGYLAALEAISRLALPSQAEQLQARATAREARASR